MGGTLGGGASAGEVPLNVTPKGCLSSISLLQAREKRDVDR